MRSKLTPKLLFTSTAIIIFIYLTYYFFGDWDSWSNASLFELIYNISLWIILGPIMAYCVSASIVSSIGVVAQILIVLYNVIKPGE